ncbi:hemerythrin domain-containing protein [Nocardioides exalbidus]|nr:hemerythrin domain-containing protein [Nocardioides exalbidus]
MGEEMSMNQVIHAAVRRDVARTEQALRELADGDAGRAREVRTAWRNLARELTHHHEAEDEHMWPFLESRGFDVGLLEEMEAEHGAMKAALASVSASLDALVASPTSANAAAAADEVARARVVVNGHLDHEERDVEGLMDSIKEDEDFKALTKKLRPASTVDAANALAWMQDGAGERELAALRAAVPAPVVAVLTRFVARRYRREVAPVWR